MEREIEGVRMEEWKKKTWTGHGQEEVWITVANKRKTPEKWKNMYCVSMCEPFRTCLQSHFTSGLSTAEQQEIQHDHHGMNSLALILLLLIFRVLEINEPPTKNSIIYSTHVVPKLYDFMWNSKENILKVIGVWTTLGPTDFEENFFCVSWGMFTCTNFSFSEWFQSDFRFWFCSVMNPKCYNPFHIFLYHIFHIFRTWHYMCSEQNVAAFKTTIMSLVLLWTFLLEDISKRKRRGFSKYKVNKQPHSLTSS